MVGWSGCYANRSSWGRDGERVAAVLRQDDGAERAQLTRLVGRYLATGRVRIKTSHRHRFPTRCTRADIESLAQVDEAHEALSGPATRRIFEREFGQYGKLEFQRLAAISNAHPCNLRRTPRRRQRLKNYQKTRPSPVAIGERRRPDPGGRPGYLRVDKVHQGDTEHARGVYHINAVDEITQWEIVAAVPRISEAYLEPVLVMVLAQFPFVIHGFHSDNGSEFINQTVARLLNKLMIEQTKSRLRHSNDNGRWPRSLRAAAISASISSIVSLSVPFVLASCWMDVSHSGEAGTVRTLTCSPSEMGRPSRLSAASFWSGDRSLTLCITALIRL
jgi:transposase InsO family protein